MYTRCRKKQLEGTNLNDLHSKEEAQAYWEDDLQVIHSRQSKINIDEPWVTKTGNRWVSTSKIHIWTKQARWLVS